MKIRKGQLLIRDATLKDAKQLTIWWNDGKIMEHAGYPNGLGITEDKVKDLIENKIGATRLILEKNKISIGEMSYRLIEEKCAEIGIKICDETQREKGNGTIYLKMLLHYLFLEEKVERIILDTNKENKRAQHVYEKLGFQKIQENVDSWRDQIGKLQSSVDYELKREIFLKERELFFYENV